jgi:hypothetical protein
MVSDISETATSGVYQATFQFSDELPATGETDQATSYKLNIVACVSGTDADLDTIIDDMDSDRDGDGVDNSLDYDPDDSSVGTAPGDLAQIASVYPSSGGRAAGFSRSSYSSVSNFIESLDNTYYSTGRLDITVNSNPFYLLNDVLTLELYSSNQSTYEKDGFVIGYSIGSTNNTLTLYWGDSSGNSMESLNSGFSTGVGKYLKIKST